MKHVKAELEITEKGMVAVASTATVDRQGEIVEVEGWDLANFKNNPILLWGHNHHELPIGKAEDIWVEKSGSESRLMFKPKFHDFTDTAKAIKKLVNAGILKTFSVGFRPIDIDGNNYTKQELLEISLVNVPANPDAMMLSYKSLKEDGFSDDVIEDCGINLALVDMKQRLDTIEPRLEIAEKMLDSIASLGREQRAVEQNLSVSKTIVKNAEKIMQKKNTQSARHAKTIKLATEKLIINLKKEL